MNNPKRNLLPWAVTAAALSLASVSAFAQEPKNGEQSKSPAAATPFVQMEVTAFLKLDYVDSIKPAPFLEGNKLKGVFRGFASDFVKFSQKDSNVEILIPNSAILYMISESKLIR